MLVTTPFHPGYLTADLIDKAKNLKVSLFPRSPLARQLGPFSSQADCSSWLQIAVTAGVGSDHIDLDAANTKKIGVYEVTGSNVVSVAEHVVRPASPLRRPVKTDHLHWVNYFLGNDSFNPD